MTHLTLTEDSELGFLGLGVTGVKGDFGGKTRTRDTLRWSAALHWAMVWSSVRKFNLKECLVCEKVLGVFILSVNVALSVMGVHMCTHVRNGLSLSLLLSLSLPFSLSLPPPLSPPLSLPPSLSLPLSPPSLSLSDRPRGRVEARVFSQFHWTVSYPN